MEQSYFFNLFCLYLVVHILLYVLGQRSRGESYDGRGGGGQQRGPGGSRGGVGGLVVVELGGGGPPWLRWGGGHIGWAPSALWGPRSSPGPPFRGQPPFMWGLGEIKDKVIPPHFSNLKLRLIIQRITC